MNEIPCDYYILDMDDKEVIEYIYSKNHKMIKFRTNSMSEEMKSYIENRFNDSDSIYESIARIKYNIEKRPVCQICGNRVLWYKSYKYRLTCSDNCSKILNTNNRAKTSIENYGVDNPAKSNIVKDKISKANKLKSYESLNKRIITNNERYGVDNCFQSTDKKEKSKQTCISKYNTEYASQSQEIKDQIKQTCLERYGVNTPLKNENVKNKIKQTILNKYGVDNPAKSAVIQEKIVNTSNERYDVDRPIQSNEIKDKVKNTLLRKYGVTCSLQIPEILNKIKTNNLLKYGCEYHMQTTEYKQYLSNLMQDYDYQRRITETKKKNGSFVQSIKENNCYILLCEKFNIVERQYSSKKYPFNCDFYVPELDLYIECNFHWTHGGHPYNKEIDCNTLKLWQDKHTKYYDNAINTWTIRDVKKREIAKQNNLNYIEFWTENELKEWLNSN